MSVDYEAVEHHEAQGDPEYWDMLADRYNDLHAPELTKLCLTARELTALILVVTAAKGMTEGEELYELLEGLEMKLHGQLVTVGP